MQEDMAASVCTLCTFGRCSVFRVVRVDEGACGQELTSINNMSGYPG
jgi:CO dehydrogenase/acetyl-CoA synthase alpha subunit